MSFPFVLVEPDLAAERQLDIDIDAHAELGRIVEGAPTLLERFLTEDETFYTWFPDAAVGAQEEMTLCAMRPMFEALEDKPDEALFAELGHYLHSIVMSHMETASREAG